jgi:hypothetical protein
MVSSGYNASDLYSIFRVQTMTPTPLNEYFYRFLPFCHANYMNLQNYLQPFEAEARLNNT